MSEPICPICGAKLFIGSYPFCKGRPEDHDTVQSIAASTFQPTVYFEGPKGELRFPGDGNEAPPAGYTRHELTTLREADSFMKRVNREEDDKAQAYHNYDKEIRQKVYKKTEERIKEMIASGQFKHKISNDLLKETLHQIQSKDWGAERADSCNFTIAPFAFDARRMRVREEDL